MTTTAIVKPAVPAAEVGNDAFGTPKRPPTARFSPLIYFIIVKSAFKSLLANKLRSILAMLGIIIGVGAVIAMLAMGSGAQKSVLARISAMGTNLLTIRPGQRGSGGVMSGTQINLTLEDAKALLTDDIPHLSAVTPVVSGNAQVKYMAQNTSTSITGIAPTYLEIKDFVVERGRPFTDAEVENSTRVAILGPVTVTNLFGEEDPLEQTIKIKGINFRVVGVLKSKGDQGWFNPDDQILVPYTLALHQLFGRQSIRNSLREIDLQADDADNLNQLQDAVTDKLRQLHKTPEGQPSDFQLQNQADILETANETINTFRILLGSIASISLLVGGIGIMNIMLVTVTERTREIGIRKAIGAKDRDILTQFLVESILMSGLGGIIGAAAGIASAELIARFTSFSTLVQPFFVVLSISFAGAVGIFFGLYPAYRAAQLDPIEALRYE